MFKNPFKKNYEEELPPDLDEMDRAIDKILENQPNVTDLVREQLKGITLNFSGNEEALEDNLDENEKKELYANAEIIKNNRAFKMVLSYLINVQGNYCVKEAEIMEHVSFGRATINGLSLFREEIERLSNLHRELSKKEEEFDPHAGV